MLSTFSDRVDLCCYMQDLPFGLLKAFIMTLIPMPAIATVAATKSCAASTLQYYYSNTGFTYTPSVSIYRSLSLLYSQ